MAAADRVTGHARRTVVEEPHPGGEARYVLMNLTACQRLALQPINTIWYRAISAEHWETALRTDQTVQAPTRFHPGPVAKTPFEILYLAENQLVALYEVGAILGPPDQPVVHPSKRKMMLIDVSVRLQSVADLTDPAQQALLK